MASSLTFQLRQQVAEFDKKHQPTQLPSPPNSSCDDDVTEKVVEPQQERRDSLHTHFSALTLQALSVPANFTIDHASIKQSLQQWQQQRQHTPNPSSSPVPSSSNLLPIPIHASASNSVRRSSQSHFPTSPSSVAAATGGLTVRHHRRPSTLLDPSRKRTDSPSLKAASSLPTSQYRCDDCGKAYKSPSCLAKHRWEHSEEWELTSKLLLTKHQQVQMLEAAAILVSMDQKKPDSPVPSSLPTHMKQEATVQYIEPDTIVTMHHNEADDEDEDVDILDEDDDKDMSDPNPHRFQPDDDDDDEEEEEESINIDDDDDDDLMMDMDQDDPQSSDHQPIYPIIRGASHAKLPASFSLGS
ncbi:hypothetical protein DM01DRAFT_1383388 [Hesseltinella vesiculosa]|uniref:C2H2-type domain-containing protein n=1 Tax=Hesseltinella vesiculosa TaxID=101127 RepID=A0A1X2GHG1_9FUNG|nr:hypothetical protein DM01DRAFT_1383388 [Hesseltinella vesiculosa]